MAGGQGRSTADHYSRWSSRYDSDCNLTRDLDEAVTRQLLAGRSFDRVIEAGCGTGKNTLHFAAVARAVQALDFSPGMLAVAARRVATPNVTFHQADLTAAWPCEPASADLVSFNLVLEHIADVGQPLAHAVRAVRPGGLVLLSELHPFRQYQGSQARFSDADGREVKVAAFTHHVSDYLRAADAHGLRLVQLDEWWHAEDRGAPPRLLTCRFERTR